MHHVAGAQRRKRTIRPLRNSSVDIGKRFATFDRDLCVGNPSIRKANGRWIHRLLRFSFQEAEGTFTKCGRRSEGQTQCVGNDRSRLFGSSLIAGHDVMNVEIQKGQGDCLRLPATELRQHWNVRVPLDQTTSVPVTFTVPYQQHFGFSCLVCIHCIKNAEFALS